MELQLQISDIHDYYPLFLKSMQGTMRDQKWEQQAVIPSHIGSGEITRMRIRSGMEIVITDVRLVEDLKLTIKESCRLLEFNYSLNGDTYCAWNGRERHISRQQGNVVFLEDSQIYVERKALIRNQFLEIRMSPEHLFGYTDSIEDRGSLEAFLKRHTDSIDAYEVTPAIEKCVHDMYFCTYQGPLKKLYLESKAMEIIALVNQDHSFVQPPSKAKVIWRKQDREVIEQARELILTHLENPLTIRQLSRQVGMNEFKLKQGFRELYDMTIFEQVRKARLERALWLMETEQVNIGQAAVAVGYSNASNFTAAFRKQYGCNPSEYVKRHFGY
ncbi:helix-turn-helix transcriptional regulator [Brevibacillus reuszeri]|uniref:helix-turn-helix transcriptional regulator n=1 Tax=Brevibacillus reuszeri TaxID=54915 RepID=UPI003D21E95C